MGVVSLCLHDNGIVFSPAVYHMSDTDSKKPEQLHRPVRQEATKLLHQLYDWSREIYLLILKHEVKNSRVIKY